jgi:phosphatidylethanolamine N-methyltransferase
MSTSTARPGSAGLDHLRQRARAPSTVTDDASSNAAEGPESGVEDNGAARLKRTYGRTPDGTGMLHASQMNENENDQDRQS